MKNNTLKILLLISFSIIIFSQCDMGSCEGEMSDKRNQYGNPDEINTFDDGNYHSEDWWYWSKGVSFTFTWGEYSDGCEISKYTFEPINNINESTKSIARNSKILIEVCPCEF